MIAFNRVFVFSIALSICWISYCTNALSQDSKQSSNATKGNEAPPELSDVDKKLLNQRIAWLLEKDQQFRSYLSYQTTDEAEIARIKKLGMKEQLQEMANSERKLSDEVRKLLTQLQLKNDREVLAEFIEIVKKYGYPSPERLGVKTDKLFVVLLHPPVKREKVENHLAEMKQLLKPEVVAGRMDARRYATFVDNMRGKILRRPQLYGTNQMFDPKTRKILPPIIESLDRANAARREIGLPQLKEGEYRLAKTESRK